MSLLIRNKVSIYSNHTQKNERIWEVDALRGVAFLGMILHHFIFGLFWFGVITYAQVLPVLGPLGSIVRWIFIGLVGVSSWLWYMHITQSKLRNVQNKQKKVPSLTTELLIASIFRAFPIACAAGVITIGSFLASPDYFVHFGVLHVLALSTLLVVPFLFIADISWFFGVAVLISAALVPKFVFIPVELLSIFPPTNIIGMLDYFPLFPWFGVVLIGVTFGKKIYGTELQSRSLHFLPANIENIFCFIGRNALYLYVLHIPFVIALSWGISQILRMQ